jgi:transposase InsO family protein
MRTEEEKVKYVNIFKFSGQTGIEPTVLPPRSPNLNAYCERFVRSIKEEALEQMVMLGDRSLYDAMQQYLTHYWHTERNHQGLDNQLIVRGGQ